MNRDRRLSSEEMFEKARQLTTWHYQWMIVHEFLPLFIGQAMVNDILRNGRRFYRPDVGFIPVEFQGAAYRFGHSMVRPVVPGEPGRRQRRLGLLRDDLRPLGGGPGRPGRPARWRPGAPALHRLADVLRFRPDLHGRPAGNTNPAIRPNKLIDTTISTPLLRLPIQTIAGGVPGDIISLP